MVWVEPTNTGGSIKCKRHPYENRQPGVCSFCLREKLSQISTNSISNNNNYSCSSSPYSFSPPGNNYSSVSYFSASTSPTNRWRHNNRRKRRNGSVVMSSINYGLKKSRSIAAIVRRNRVVGDDGVGGEKREKKSGFWSKFVKSSGTDKKLVTKTES